MSLLIFFTSGAAVTNAAAGLAEAAATAPAPSVTTSSLPAWTTPGDAVPMSASPVLAFTIPGLASAMHFNIQLDTADTFDTGDLRDLLTTSSTTGWEYWDGGAWQPFPAGGVANTYAGNEARHTVQTPLAGGTWYRRVRAGT